MRYVFSVYVWLFARTVPRGACQGGSVGPLLSVRQFLATFAAYDVKLKMPDMKKTSFLLWLWLTLLSGAAAQHVSVSRTTSTRLAGPLPVNQWALRDSTRLRSVRVSMELPYGSAPEGLKRLVGERLSALAEGVLGEWSGACPASVPAVRIADSGSFVSFFDALTDSVEARAREAGALAADGGLRPGTQWLSYGLAAEWPGLATFRTTAYAFRPGAAHGLATDYAETYDIHTLERFSTALFADTLALKQRLYEGLRGVLGEEPSGVLFCKAAPGDDGFGRAFPLPQCGAALMKEGVGFVYQPYEIAPYAAGLLRVTLSPQELLPLATAEGRRWLERVIQSPEGGQ